MTAQEEFNQEHQLLTLRFSKHMTLLQICALMNWSPIQAELIYMRALDRCRV